MADGAERPLLTFDLDGVLARPPLGLNLTINRALQGQPATQEGAAPGEGGWTFWERLLARAYYPLRYGGRSPLPEAAAAVTAAAQRYRVSLLSARNWRGRAATEGWLHRHGILPYLDAVHLNDSGAPAAQFKRERARLLGVVRHVEDDAATAALLARDGVQVDLIDWPRNRGLAYPPDVTRRESLHAFIAALQAEARTATD